MIDYKTPMTRALLTHPVIETFLNIKWQKVKKYFFLNFLLYLSFLLMYSLFLANIFYRNDVVGSIKLSDIIGIVPMRINQNKLVLASEINVETLVETTTMDPDTVG
jgi:hypothetical protein